MNLASGLVWTVIYVFIFISFVLMCTFCLIIEVMVMMNYCFENKKFKYSGIIRVYDDYEIIELSIWSWVNIVLNFWNTIISDWILSFNNKNAGLYQILRMIIIFLTWRLSIGAKRWYWLYRALERVIDRELDIEDESIDSDSSDSEENDVTNEEEESNGRNENSSEVWDEMTIDYYEDDENIDIEDQLITETQIEIDRQNSILSEFDCDDLANPAELVLRYMVLERMQTPLRGRRNRRIFHEIMSVLLCKDFSEYTNYKHVHQGRLRANEINEINQIERSIRDDVERGDQFIITRDVDYTIDRTYGRLDFARALDQMTTNGEFECDDVEKLEEFEQRAYRLIDWYVISLGDYEGKDINGFHVIFINRETEDTIYYETEYIGPKAELEESLLEEGNEDEEWLIDTNDIKEIANRDEFDSMIRRQEFNWSEDEYDGQIDVIDTTFGTETDGEQSEDEYDDREMEAVWNKRVDTVLDTYRDLIQKPRIDLTLKPIKITMSRGIGLKDMRHIYLSDTIKPSVTDNYFYKAAAFFGIETSPLKMPLGRPQRVNIVEAILWKIIARIITGMTRVFLIVVFLISVIIRIAIWISVVTLKVVMLLLMFMVLMITVLFNIYIIVMTYGMMYGTLAWILLMVISLIILYKQRQLRKLMYNGITKSLCCSATWFKLLYDERDWGKFMFWSTTILNIIFAMLIHLYTFVLALGLINGTIVWIVFFVIWYTTFCIGDEYEPMLLVFVTILILRLTILSLGGVM